jgi:NitT/TauT family transport system substrate-binding protein
VTPLPAALARGSELIAWRLDWERHAALWSSGEGARIEGGRWNSVGQRAVYCSLDPAITILERSGAIKVVAEAVSEKGSRAVFGAALPAGCLYTKSEFIRKNPNTVQALTNAIVRALKWLRRASAEDVANTVPPQYLAGDRGAYLAALEKSREAYSTDGMIPPAGVQTLYNVLRTFDPAVRDAPALTVGRAYDNGFVEKALARYAR